MKKIVFLLCGMIVFTSFLAKSQSTELTTAWTYAKDNPPELAKAKASIDKALLHDQTKNLPKTWNFKGMIYGKIAITDNYEFSKLCDDCLAIAYEAIKKSMELDIKKEFIVENKNVLIEILSTEYFNRGVTIYNVASEIENDTVRDAKYIKIGTSNAICKMLLTNPDNITKSVENNKETVIWTYPNCVLKFENTILSQIDGSISDAIYKKLTVPLTKKEIYSMALKNFDTFWEIMEKLENEQYYVIKFLEENKIKLSSIRLYTGYCAQETGDFEKAKKNLSQIVDMKSDEITAKTNTEAVYYTQYANLLSKMGYFDEATEVIERARYLWPENKNLTLVELKIYMDNGKTNELSNKLKTALEADPNNLNLLSTYAGTLGEIAVKDTANSAMWIQKASEAYLKAIDMTNKYKDELKYKINGTSSSFTVSYLNENSEKKTEVVVPGWEYAFNVKADQTYSIVGIIKDKKTVVTVTVTLAGSLINEISNESGKNSASVSGKITKEDLDKNNNLYNLYYNLGVLYFNPGVEVYNNSINESDVNKYKELEKKYIELFDKALPYIEKAHEISPKEKIPMQVLLKIYLVKKDNDAVKRINEEIKGLKK